MDILSLLALFALLTISSATYFAAKRLKLPYTVLLVAVGLALVPISNIPLFSFLNDFTLTPELLFYIFLPILIFESAYNINIRKLQENIWSISLLSIVSLLISTFFIAGALYVIFHAVGMELPFMIFLLFGALISATDPVAVLALFKEYGAPRRLSLIFEGESLFNDGTAVALFLIVLEIALVGWHGTASIAEGVFMFLSMVVGGIIFGVIMGGTFSKFIQATRSNESVSIMLMIVLAHTTFILSEIISEHFIIFGQEIKFSSIIATTVASMLLGNYGRYKIAPKAEEFIERFWGQFAFIANSLVFVLIGLLFSTLPFNIQSFIVPIIIAVTVVALGRALSVYPVIALFNKLRFEDRIPTSWQHLLAWGSLRGALAVTMVLLIPDAWFPAGWNFAFTPKEFILALTIGCIYATLFIKATTIGSIIRRLRIDELNPIEKVEYEEATQLVYAKVRARLDSFLHKGYIDTNSYHSLIAHYGRVASIASSRYSVAADRVVSMLVLRMYAIGIEKHFLRELYAHHEISERVMRQLMTKLATQLTYLEHGNTVFDPAGRDKKDWFEMLAVCIRSLIPARSEAMTEERYMYYRAKAIISRKVISELEKISSGHKEHFFDADTFAEVMHLYEGFRSRAVRKISELAENYKEIIEPINRRLAARGLFKIEELVVGDLAKKEMVTPKLAIILREQFEEESERLDT